MEYNKLIFVAQTGTCREAMAAGIMGDLPCGIRWRFYPVALLYSFRSR